MKLTSALLQYAGLLLSMAALAQARVAPDLESRKAEPGVTYGAPADLALPDDSCR